MSNNLIFSEDIKETLTLNDGAIWYFLTLSLDVDYTPSKEMNVLLKKIFLNSFAILEHGENGKTHFHLLGQALRRSDNIKNAIKEKLKKEEYEVTPYSVHMEPEVKVMYRLGYLHKEGSDSLWNTVFPEEAIKRAIKVYQESPNKKRTEIKDGKFNVNKLVEMARQECRTASEVEQFINDITKGMVPFSQWQKINWKRFRQYVLSEYKEDDK